MWRHLGKKPAAVSVGGSLAGIAHEFVGNEPAGHRPHGTEHRQAVVTADADLKVATRLIDRQVPLHRRYRLGSASRCGVWMLRRFGTAGGRRQRRAVAGPPPSLMAIPEPELFPHAGASCCRLLAGNVAGGSFEPAIDNGTTSC